MTDWPSVSTTTTQAGTWLVGAAYEVASIDVVDLGSAPRAPPVAGWDLPFQHLADEDDTDFVNGIWVQATQGKTARAVEEEAMVDGYRIFRLFEHWLQEGALELKS